MNKIKLFINENNVEGAVSALNKAFVYAEESAESFKETAKEALEKFLQTYLAYGISSTEKWTLIDGKKKFDGMVWEDNENLTIGVDFDLLAKGNAQQRKENLAEAVEGLIRAFYRACMYRYFKLRRQQDSGREGLEDSVRAYETFIGRQIAPHMFECVDKTISYEEAEILARFFAYALGEGEFNKLADKLSNMEEKEEELFEGELDAEYRSLAFFPELLYRDIAVVSVENRLLADMIKFTTEMAQKLDSDNLFFITPDGIKHINLNLRKNKEKINNDYTDTSDETLEIGKLIFKLAEQFDEEVYLNYMVEIAKMGSLMLPKNTTEPLKKILFSCGKGQTLESFARNVAELAQQRRNFEEDPELESIYSTIALNHKIVAGDLTDSECDEFEEMARRALEEGYEDDDEEDYDDDYDDEEDYDDDYDDEDDGAGI